MQYLIIVFAITVLVHMDTSADVPEACSLTLRDTLNYVGLKCFPLLIVQEVSVLHQLSDDSLVLERGH